MAVKFRDYYEVLGVPRTATAERIKSAYRQLARKHHPDLQPTAERAKAAERFKEINEAYEVLSDPDKRAKYDALGESYKSGMDFTPPSGGQWRHATNGQSDDFGDFSDFFASIFETPPSGRGGRRVTMPASDFEVDVPVTLEDLLRGGKRRISLDGGRTIDVEIPPGVRDGTVLRLAGQGEPGRSGTPPGDLYVRLHLAPHPRYRPVGANLEMDLPLWPWQAALGASVKIDTPDGQVTLRVPPGTPSGRRLRLRGRGLPRGDGNRGDLYAIARIVVPEHLTDAERAAYEALERSSAQPEDRPAAG